MQSETSIWVELRFMGRTSYFELRKEGRPLGIGSGWCTDLRIHDAKVGLVHCELRREGNAVVIVPTGSADVRLNAAHVGARTTLPGRCLVEFLEHEIEVVLHIGVPCFVFGARDPETELGPQLAPPVTLGHTRPRPLAPV